jgi:oligoribonuclease
MVCNPQNLIWLDLEMTGLKVESHTIIEIALVITDKELNELERWPQGDSGQAIYQPEPILKGSEPWVKQNLAPLLARVRLSSVDLAEAEDKSLALVRRHCPEMGGNRKEGCPLAGNSIGQDRAFLRARMPKFEQYTGYRNVDVSTIKELVKRWYPDRCYQKPALGKHNAMVDVLASIEELRYYRREIFTR